MIPCFSRFHSRRNYVLNSDSYGQSLLENYDDLDYSFDDEKALADEEEFDVCEECHHQNNFLHEIDSVIKEPNEVKNFRGCRRNQHVIKNNPYDIDNKIHKKNLSYNLPREEEDELKRNNTNTHFIRTSVAHTEKVLKNNWKKIKREFSAKLIDIPDEHIKEPPRSNGQDVRHNKVSDYNTFPNRLNEKNCGCNSENNGTNNYCNNHQCLLRYRELPTKFSNVPLNESQKTIYYNEPILEPIRSIAFSQIDE